MRFRTAWLWPIAIALSTTAAADPLVAGQKAPDFAGRRLDGETVSVAAFAGKVVVLSFWASWCGPCQRELPLLEGIQRSAGPERIQVVAINIEPRDTFRRIAPKMRSLAMLVSSDAGEGAQREYGVSGIPHMVIVGRDGTIQKIHHGYSEAGVDKVVADLNAALAS